MSVSIRQVRHRWAHDRADDDRLFATVCGIVFLATTNPRDWIVHEPAKADCQTCYPVPA